MMHVFQPLKDVIRISALLSILDIPDAHLVGFDAILCY
jgi:hypothetical protein